MPLRARLGDALFRVTAGPEGPRHRRRIHGRPGPRWFDPASPIGIVHGDASMYVGGLRALLLQTLHPAAMTGVSEHSDYRHDMLGRLARTSTFLAVTTFGHEDDAQQAVDAVRRIHERITGTLPDGTPYAATDPHLLGWVHVAEIDSFLRAHQAYGRQPLDQAGRDEYVAQTAVVARKLGVADPPTTEAGLADAARVLPTRAGGDPPRPRGGPPRRPPTAAAARPPGRRTACWSRPPSGCCRGGPASRCGLPDLPVSERTVVRALGTAATGTIRWVMTPGRATARELADAR